VFSVISQFSRYLSVTPSLFPGYQAKKTLYRYTQLVKSFLKWDGQPLEEFKVKIPRTLPPYIEDAQIADWFQRYYQCCMNLSGFGSEIPPERLTIE